MKPVQRKHIDTYYGAALFLLVSVWFYFPCEYVLIANQDKQLFFSSLEHLNLFLDRPGGMLEYLGHFLTQFFRFRLAGTLILAGLVTLGFFLSKKILVQASGKKRLKIMAMIVPVFLVGMHNFYPHPLHFTLGFLAVMSVVLLIPEDRRKRRIFFALVVPVLYMLTGGFIWFYGILVLAIRAGQRKFHLELLLWMLAYPLLLVFLTSGLFSLYPIKDLAFSPVPVDQSYSIPFLPYMFMGWMVLMIFLSALDLKWTFLRSGWGHVSEALFLVTAVVLILNFSYNRKNAEFFTIEKLAINENWDGLLTYVDQHPSTNLFANFYTNLALLNKGALCSALFDYPQPYGRRALCFGWEAKEEILKRGGDFFWAIHFVNETHHWSFESMVVTGFTRRNLKHLIQTELVRGNYLVAQKYIRLFGRTLFDRKLARHFQAFVDHPETIERDPELGPRRKARFTHDFFADGMDLEKNLRSLITNDPENRSAFEYLMALFLLEKRIDDIAFFLPGYARLTGGNLPRLLEESLLIYKLLNKEEMLTKLEVSKQTALRFDSYYKVLQRSRNQNEAARALYPEYKNSFWFYMNFSKSPSQ